MEAGAKLKFSIVTVCRNVQDTIEKTIQSILSQTYPNIEYIIIDGASTDNTLAVVQKYSSKISRIISEPDKGIYDAMNKGIANATGDYVFFLNAGDKLVSEYVIQKVSELITASAPQPDVFYGKILVLDETNIWGYISGIDFVSDKILFLDNLPHQSTFVRVPLLKERSFNTAYKIAADFDWFAYGHAVKKYTFKYSDIIISVFDPFGLSSDANSLQARTNERLAILKTYYSKAELIRHLFYHYAKALRLPAVKRDYVLRILNQMRANLLGL